MSESTQTLQPTDMIPAVSIPLDPDADFDPTIQQISTMVGDLSPHRQRILVALCENMVSGNLRSDTEIAADLGIDRTTIWYARKNPAFGAALAILMRNLAQGMADKALTDLVKHSANSPKATEIWLRIAKVFDPVEKRLNVNASLTSPGQAGSLQDIIDDFLIKLGAAGYPIEKLVERYQELRAEGAF